MDAKKLMLFCENVVAEVISLKSGLGRPRENFICTGHISLATQCQQSFRRVVFMHHPRYHFPDVQVLLPHREQFRNILLYYPHVPYENEPLYMRP